MTGTDPKVENCIKENYGWALILSATYGAPRWHTCAYLLIICHGLPSVTALVLFSDDINVKIEAVHWSVFLISATIGVVERQFRDKTMYKIFKATAYDYFDYGNTLDEKTQKEIEGIKANRNYWRNLLGKGYARVLIFSASSLIVGRFALEVWTGRFFKPQEENGMIYALPVPIWAPHKDDYNILKYVYTFFIEIYIVLTVTGIVITMDVLMIVFGENAIAEFKILQTTIRNLELRARYVFSYRHGSSPKNPSDPQFTRCMRDCLMASIKHHKELMKFVDDLGITYRYIQLLIFIGGAMLICMAAVMFTFEGVNFVSKFIFIAFGSAESVHIFIHAFYGQAIKDAHNLIQEGLYNCNWVDHNKTLKSYWLILHLRCSQPLALSSGGFFDTDLDAFSSVMSKAYSFYNVINAT